MGFEENELTVGGGWFLLRTDCSRGSPYPINWWTARYTRWIKEIIRTSKSQLFASKKFFALSSSLIPDISYTGMKRKAQQTLKWASAEVCWSLNKESPFLFKGNSTSEDAMTSSVYMGYGELQTATKGPIRCGDFCPRPGWSNWLRAFQYAC